MFKNDRVLGKQVSQHTHDVVKGQNWLVGIVQSSGGNY